MMVLFEGVLILWLKDFEGSGRFAGSFNNRWWLETRFGHMFDLVASQWYFEFRSGWLLIHCCMASLFFFFRLLNVFFNSLNMTLKVLWILMPTCLEVLKTKKLGYTSQNWGSWTQSLTTKTTGSTQNFYETLLHHSKREPSPPAFKDNKQTHLTLTLLACEQRS